MRKIILAATLATLAAGVATPALAQQGYHGNRAEVAYRTPARNADIRHDINDLDRRIDRAYANRAISRAEAVGLHREAGEVKRLYARYAGRGLSGSEYRSLERRVSGIVARLHSEKRDVDGRRG